MRVLWVFIADVEGLLMKPKGFQLKSWESRLTVSRDKPRSRLETDAPLCPKCKTRMKVRTESAGTRKAGFPGEIPGSSG